MRARAAVHAHVPLPAPCTQVSAALEAGPGRDLEAFLAALECLERSHSYLQAHAGLAAARTALARSQELFDASLHACDADFRAGVAPPGRGGAAAAAWLRERLQQSPATACAADAPPLELVPRELLPKLRREATLLLDSQYGPAQDGYLATRGHALKQVCLPDCAAACLPGFLHMLSE
jgi:hypothetical protein